MAEGVNSVKNGHAGDHPSEDEILKAEEWKEKANKSFKGDGQLMPHWIDWLLSTNICTSKIVHVNKMESH